MNPLDPSMDRFVASPRPVAEVSGRSSSDWLVDSVDDVFLQAVSDGNLKAPDLRGLGTLTCFSDYADAGTRWAHDTYSFLVGPKVAFDFAESELLESGQIPDSQWLQSLAYKHIKDQRKRQLRENLLAAADRVPGLLLTVAVASNVRSLFGDDPEQFIVALRDSLALQEDTNLRFLERASRIMHFACYSIARVYGEHEKIILHGDRDPAFQSNRTVAEKVINRCTAVYLPRTKIKSVWFHQPPTRTVKAETAKKVLWERWIDVADLACAGARLALVRDQSSADPPRTKARHMTPVYEFLERDSRLQKLNVMIDFNPKSRCPELRPWRYSLVRAPTD